MSQNMPPAPAPQQRTLAILEWLIAEAERDARRRAARPVAAGDGDPARARERLRAAKDRLRLLRHSRYCLLTGEPPGARH